jgi:hypothetical protein
MKPMILAVGWMLAVLALAVGAATVIHHVTPAGQVVEKIRCIGQSSSFCTPS